MHLAFICTANICRSVMAHAILETIAKAEGLDIKVSSGGTLNLGPATAADHVWMTCVQNDTRRPKACLIRSPHREVSHQFKFGNPEWNQGNLNGRGWGTEIPEIRVPTKGDRFF